MNAKSTETQTQAPTNKVSKLRMTAGGVLGTVGVSLVASLIAPGASADPYQPFSGPRHPVRHYVGMSNTRFGRSRIPCAPLSPKARDIIQPPHPGLYFRSGR